MQYRANGKFLLTGEYLVLRGALALALPLQLGQSLNVSTLEISGGMIHWDAFTSKGFWFTAMLDKHNFSVRASDDPEKAERLSEIFKVLKKLNQNILTDSNDYNFTTRLEFDPSWGLGSSSSLISNLSAWAEVDPYSVLNETFGGSGYDIACARCENALHYHLRGNEPVVEECVFNPSFVNNLYFVYQGHKQNSSREVKAFKTKLLDYDFEDEINAVSEISQALPNVNSFNDFCYLLNLHEDIIASCIAQSPLRNRFPDFEGCIKSLGAWGGDFFLAASEWEEKSIKKYFNDKGFTTIFRYKDIVI